MLREYQQRTIDQLYAWFSAGNTGNPCWVAVYEIEGQAVANGEPGEGVYGSKELLANAAACVAGDPMVMALRKEWNGRIVK